MRKNGITLRFTNAGGAFIHHNNFCEGSSAGWSGGGELKYDLPVEFYLNMDAKTIVEKYVMERCCEAVATNGILSGLLEKAKSKGGFFLDFSK